MDALAEGLSVSDVDAEMTALTPEDVTEEDVDAGDEVEHLRNSLREAVHDDNVRPKMQCLMMDSSFSMVTMQGEDSGIAWETTPSRCNTPWASEAGNPPVDLSSLVTAQPAAPGSVPAGKIIFVMDEEVMARRKRSREKVSGQKGRQREDLELSSENVSGRPELVEVSQPNVKTEEEGEEEANDPLVDKEQRLFSLVSEGSEILNIVVPPKLVTVDEEESRDMVDNLSYLEESLVPKTIEETNDYELLISPGHQAEPSAPNIMDPPGAPVARAPVRGAAAGDVDYFEPFTLIDAQAPGGPAVIAQGQEARGEEEEAAESEDGEQPAQSKEEAVAATTTATDYDQSDTISLEGIGSELLDEVFYSGTGDFQKALDTELRAAPPRLPSKPSGSTLFGSQEEILTPIFLPEGPPKIIDPILLEEPKAMAFLYTDLYEEAVGSRVKEEDAESVASEKSFHSRHSDREARGYLEKYVLIDETPAVEVEPADKEELEPEEGSRVLAQDLYDLGGSPSEMPNSEEEITDFFRSSGNSSPCDVEPFAQSLNEDEAQSPTKSKGEKNKNVVKVAKIPTDPLSISSFEFPSEEPDWGSADDHHAALDDDQEHQDQDEWKLNSEAEKPVAPPRKKAAAAPKSCLDLTPLTPVDGESREKEESGEKEQREEEKESASPAETADEGDGEEPTRSFSRGESSATGEQTDSVKDDDETAETRDAGEARGEVKDTKSEEEGEGGQTAETEGATKQTEPEEADMKSTEPAKNKGQCVIL